MKILARNARRERRGWALVFAVFTAFVAASFASLMFVNALTSSRVAEVHHRSTEARYVAEGAVEEAKKVAQTAIANWMGVPTDGVATINGEAVPYTIEPTGQPDGGDG